MHHFPAGPSLSARVLAAISRWGRLLWRCVPTRPGRLAFALLVTTMVTGLVLAVPVVSGTHLSKHPVALDASSSSPQAADGGSPVVMGQDGAPVAAGTATGSAGDPSATSAAPDATVTAPQDTLPAEAPSASAPLDASTAPGPAPAGTTPAPKPPMLPGTRAPAPKAPGMTPPVQVPTPPVQAPTPRVRVPAPPAPPPSAAGPEAQVLALVNQARAGAGCAPLAADARLAAVARAHSADMRDRRYFDHDTPEGRSPYDRAAAGGARARAENIAQGQRDAAQVMARWMSSPGHRANILDCDLTRMGVGVAEGPRGPWWTQLFD